MSRGLSSSLGSRLSRSLCGLICCSRQNEASFEISERTLASSPAEPDATSADRKTLHSFDCPLCVGFLDELHESAMLARGYFDLRDSEHPAINTDRLGCTYVMDVAKGSKEGP